MKYVYLILKHTADTAILSLVRVNGYNSICENIILLKKTYYISTFHILVQIGKPQAAKVVYIATGSSPNVRALGTVLRILIIFLLSSYLLYVCCRALALECL